MYRIRLLALLFLPLLARTQSVADPTPFGRSIIGSALQQHLNVIAGKAYEGRETATPGQQKAAAYIEKFFSSIHLKPAVGDSAYQLFYPVFRDSLGTASIVVNNDSFSQWTDFDANLSSNLTGEMASNQVVFAGYGISDSLEDDYQGLDAQGKIVLILNGYPPGVLKTAIKTKKFNAFAKADAAQKHGAVAVLIVQPDFPHEEVPVLGPMYVSRYKKVIRPLMFNVSGKVARSIMGQDYTDSRSGKVSGRSYTCKIALSFTKQQITLHSSDVIGYLEGSDLKDQWLIISAHYDHLGKKDSIFYPGADDDGSGTVSVLEIAAAFARAKAAGKGPRRSILFLANSGEEKGLWGSDYYADHPLFPLDKTTADLNIDMIGRRDPARKQGDSNNYVYIVGDDKLSTELHPLSVATNRRYTKLELDYKFNDPKDPLRIYFRSDHYNFAKKGVPVIFYFDGIHADYHQPTDTPDKINDDLLEKRARLVFYTAWEMANRPAMLNRNKPLPQEE